MSLQTIKLEIEIHVGIESSATIETYASSVGKIVEVHLSPS